MSQRQETEIPNVHIQGWRAAIEVFQGKRKPSPNLIRPEPPTLEEWWCSDEGAVARDLLHLTEQEIVLGHSEEVMSRTHAIVLTHNGFYEHSGVVGMAAAYNKGKPRRESCEIETVERCLIDGYLEGASSSADIVAHIRTELDDLALRIHEEELKPADTGQNFHQAAASQGKASFVTRRQM